MTTFEDTDPRIDTGMDIFNKFIERSGMEKKSYQYDGVKWLLQNELRDVTSGSIRGGFVADEMGLGKTIMMIGLCLANFKHNRKTLIVLPPVLIEQWYAQIYRTTGHKSVIYHGDNKKIIEKKAAANAEPDSDPFEGAIIVLCSYDAISIFREKTGSKRMNLIVSDDNKQSKKRIENSLLHRVKWSRVIFDEAHHLRNKTTSRYLGAKLLKSDIKWLVTGTPVQNRKQDFYALCSLINLPASYYTNPDNYAQMVDTFILKRTKKHVGIDLEDAHHIKNIVSWKSEAELKFSQEIHALIAFTNVKSPSPSPSNEDNILVVPKGLLPLLLKARQSCIYPKMVKTINSINGNGLLDQNPRSNPTSTSKLDSVVGAILERKDNGNGKLVFCHFKEEINEIAERLLNNSLNVGILDGKITQVARRKLLSEKKDVLILQIQTGCEGLNLQDNYSEIYFVSPHWNPYIEEQAIARCHRIGQKKPVFVLRFEMNNFGYCSPGGPGGDSDRDVTCNIITARTKNIEEYVIGVQNVKRNIVRQIIIE